MSDKPSEEQEKKCSADAALESETAHEQSFQLPPLVFGSCSSQPTYNREAKFKQAAKTRKTHQKVERAQKTSEQTARPASQPASQVLSNGKEPDI